MCTVHRANCTPFFFFFFFFFFFLVHFFPDQVTRRLSAMRACLLRLHRLAATPARGGVVRAQSHRAASTRPGGERILVTGAGGQIGQELVPALRALHGGAAVLATDVRPLPALSLGGPGGAPQSVGYLDVTDGAAVAAAAVNHGATLIVHLSSLLSAAGERAPERAMAVNARGTENVLAAAVAAGARVFAPSTIAVFGPSTPRDATPNDTVLRPTTIYGVTKVYGELLGEYYAAKFGVDFRALRYPGVISNKAPPGGGTTDYAVDIFYAALRDGRYSCFLKPDTPLPMMYMPDCLRATLELIAAPAPALRGARAFNLTAVSFTPAELAAAIRVHMPAFEITYAPDFRQAIADSWPRSIDDSLARESWGWKHRFGLPEIAKDMLVELAHRLRLPVPPALKAAAADADRLRHKH